MESGLKNQADPAFQKRLSEFIQERVAQARKIIEEQESNEHLGPVGQIFLTGEYAHIPPFYDQLKTSFPEKKVLVGDPKQQLTVDNRRFWEQYQKHGGQIPYSVFFVDALGVARQYLFKRPGSNLLPAELKRTFFLEKIQLMMMLGSVSMVLFSLIFASYLLVLHGRLTQERDELAIDTKRIENTLFGTRYQEIKSQLTQFNNEINQLSDIDRALFSVPEMINQVTQSLPAGIKLTGYVYDDASLRLKLTGIADDRESLLLLQDQLKALLFVKEVFAPLSNYDGKENVSFSVDLTLSFSELPYYGSPNPS
jgi:hypothetical protein